MFQSETISAIATAPGAGGIGIVRISGEKALAVAEAVFRSRSGRSLGELDSYRAAYGKLLRPDGSVIDEAIALVMRGPHSYTTEDVVELQCHGGSLPLRETLSATYAAGARPAEPGEFTKRAFLGGRLDLSQAQAVMDVINAKTGRALKEAQGHLSGRFSGPLKEARQELLAAIAHIEATIDFPEEGVDEVVAGEIRVQVEKIRAGFGGLLAAASTGRILREGLVTAIVGKPNVGKSSLLNALLQEERAIVTDIPGTTRDAIEEYADINGVPLRIIDTAGIRQTLDRVEQIGVERAKDYIGKARLVLALFDGSRPLEGEDEALLELLPLERTMALLTKQDLPPVLTAEKLTARLPGCPVLSLSLRRGEARGMEQLTKAITDFVYGSADPTGEQTFLRDEREADLLRRADAHLAQALGTIDSGLGLDFLSIDLRSAWETLGELTGESIGDDIVDKIFSTFCIGK